MSEHLEALLREAWDRGFQDAMKATWDGTWDIPNDHKFERYMEDVVDELTEGTPSKENSSDDE